MYHIRTYLVSARYQPTTKMRICRYVCTCYQPADHSMVPGTYVQYRANTQQQQRHPAVCTGHSSTRIARHTYAVYEARFLRKYPVYEYQQSVVCTVACILPPSCTVAVARTRSRSSSLYRMLLCTCSSYTGICVTRLDVYVYQSVRIVVCKRVYEYWYHPPVIPFFLSFCFLHGRWCPLYVCSFFFCNTPPTCNHHNRHRFSFWM